MYFAALLYFHLKLKLAVWWQEGVRVRAQRVKKTIMKLFLAKHKEFLLNISQNGLLRPRDTIFRIFLYLSFGHK